MKQTHENISSLLNSNFGMFVYERLKPFNNVSVRRTTLEIFRDHVLVNSSLESKLQQLLDQHETINRDIVQMILIIQVLSFRKRHFEESH
ncbi:hypothetical protein QR98_0054950 [Sarcoptes scabiei]|uniref:Uncharacterized protein n=1 Tax=Sarcoptes scabiei TaxID=52283 RepID=A0A132A7R5_SARSC|nr:hypothetical protein QR98_0054950 [Sarcoptes scabiei]